MDFAKINGKGIILIILNWILSKDSFLRFLQKLLREKKNLIKDTEIISGKINSAKS